MKKIITITVVMLTALSTFAQPKLTKDNVEEVLKAMTLEEKALLSVGGSRAVTINGIPTGAASLVPGAAGTTRPIERLGIPATVVPAEIGRAHV